MGRNNKKRKGAASGKQKPDEAPRIWAFPAELEPTAERLYDLVYRGADSVLADAENLSTAMSDPTFRARFFAAAHRGFATAQDEVVERLVATSTSTPAEATLCRKVMDGAAWQMLRDQLYLARRLYLGHKPPSLVDANYEAARQVASDLTSSDFLSFALMSDLTTFVQVGDLLVVSPEKGLEIVEVKEGEVNHRILEFLQSYASTRCGRALDLFAQNEGRKGIDQMGRILRQEQRMRHVVTVANEGVSIDPDTQQRVVVPDEPIALDHWDDALATALEEAHERDWAIQTVDECLYIGAYRGKFRLPGPYVFRACLEGEPPREGYPSVNLMQSMTMPLALPILSRTIPRKHKFDVLFGRAVVHVGLNMDAFIDLCNKSGLPARWSTRKEAAKYQRRGAGPWLLDHRAILVGEEPNVGPIADGIFARVFFHATTPASMVAMLKRYASLRVGAERDPSEPG